MQNCSNIFAYARNMLLACTPAINWFLFVNHSMGSDIPPLVQ